MDDLNFLHSTYDEVSDCNKETKFQKVSNKFENTLKIIIVEDDRLLGISIKKFLEKTLVCDVIYFSSASECITNLLSDSFGQIPFCLITDISLGNCGDGLHLVDTLNEKGLKFVSIAMTGFASIETAIAATKKGVYHYLTKPFDLENLKSLVLDACEKSLGICIDSFSNTSLHNRAQISRSDKNFEIERPKTEDIFCGMIGRSKAMKAVFERIEKVALTDSTILITGPSGTGKELVASAIHQLSARKNGSKISVNCGAIPSELLESELFGHMKGSFTGAISNRKGRFELANMGTIFLDEIGDMPLLLQVKLLRVLQNRIIEPVGSTEAIDINTRVIAATHRDLEKSVMDGKFREDLFYRLNVIPVKIPSLKERREDIPLLISYFVDKFISADRSNEITFSDAALDMLLSYDWPGNVRELENIIERLVILRGGSKILPEDLPAKIFRHNPFTNNQYKEIFELPKDGIDLKKILSEIEDSLILQALKLTEGNKNQASKLLSLNRTTLIEKMKKKAIQV